MSKHLVAAAVAIVAVVCAACDRNQPPGRHVTGSATAVASPPTAASSTRLAAPASAPPAVSATAPADANLWTGTYQAKKDKLETPKKVKDVTWTNDDGSTATGSGTLQINVRGTMVQGSASGALGPQLVSGVYDGKQIRFSVMPKDPGSAGAMTGTGFGQLEQGVLKGTIQCSGADGVVVRKATFELKPSG